MRRLTTQAIGGSRFEVLLDGEPWRHVHSAVWGRPPRLPEMPEEFEEAERKVARNYVLRRLCQVELASTQAAKKLRERFVTPAIAEEVVEKIVEMGCINDERWAEGTVRGLLRQKKGIGYIRQKLLREGLPPPLIEQALEQATEEAQAEGVTRLLTTRYARRDLEDYGERQKVIRALMQRGYPLDIIHQALS